MKLLPNFLPMLGALQSHFFHEILTLLCAVRVCLLPLSLHVFRADVHNGTVRTSCGLPRVSWGDPIANAVQLLLQPRDSVARLRRMLLLVQTAYLT